MQVLPKNQDRDFDAIALVAASDRAGRCQMRSGFIHDVTALLSVRVGLLFGNTSVHSDSFKSAWRAAADAVAADAVAAVDCALQHSQSALGEDLLLLPTLLRAQQQQQQQHGSFVEIGAVDGHYGSNTFMLETCFDWTGVLLEVNNASYSRIAANRGRATIAMRRSICGTPRTIRILRYGVNGAASLSSEVCERMMSSSSSSSSSSSALNDKLCRAFEPPPSQRPQRHADVAVDEVPCEPLARILADAGLAARGGVTFLSLDVEGAEDAVLEGVDAGAVKVLEVETLRDGPNATEPCDAAPADCPGAVDPRKEARVHALLTRKHAMRLAHRLWLPSSDRAYVQSDAGFEPWPLADAPRPSMAKEPFFWYRYQLRLRAAAGKRHWGFKVPDRMKAFLRSGAPPGYI